MYSQVAKFPVQVRMSTSQNSLWKDFKAFYIPSSVKCEEERTDSSNINKYRKEKGERVKFPNTHPFITISMI